MDSFLTEISREEKKTVEEVKETQQNQKRAWMGKIGEDTETNAFGLSCKQMAQFFSSCSQCDYQCHNQTAGNHPCVFCGWDFAMKRHFLWKLEV